MQHMPNSMVASMATSVLTAPRCFVFTLFKMAYSR